MNNPRLERALEYCKGMQMRRELSAGFVYFFTCKEYLKVGVAQNVEERILQLQIGNPFKIHCVFKFESISPYEDEQMIHLMLDKYRCRGEWFKCPKQALEEMIRKLKETH